MPPITKNLGQIAAVLIQTTPPANQKLLWYDTNPAYQFLRYYDRIASAWLPLFRQFDSAPTNGSTNLLTSGSIYNAFASIGLLQFTKAGHGFLVGDILRFDASSGFVKALADTTADARMIGMVSGVPDANTFILVISGYVSGLDPALALTPASTYFLSDTVPGKFQLTPGIVPKPCVQTLTNTSCIFINAFGLDI